MESSKAVLSGLHDWHEFYVTVAVIAGTLIGLLFVSVSINPELLSRERDMRFFTNQVFLHFVGIMLISILFIFPIRDHLLFKVFIFLVLAVSVSVFSYLPLIIIVAILRRKHRVIPGLRTPRLLLFLFPSIIFYVVIFVSALQLYSGKIDRLLWLGFFMMVLLISTASNAWNVLLVFALHKEGFGRGT